MLKNFDKAYFKVVLRNVLGGVVVRVVSLCFASMICVMFPDHFIPN